MSFFRRLLGIETPSGLDASVRLPTTATTNQFFKYLQEPTDSEPGPGGEVVGITALDTGNPYFPPTRFAVDTKPGAKPPRIANSFPRCNSRDRWGRVLARVQVTPQHETRWLVELEYA